MKFKLILTLLCLFLTACIRTISNLHIDDTFTRPELKTSGIWVAGVVYDVPEFKENQDLELYGNELTRLLAKGNPDVPVLSPYNLRVKIGEESANLLMEEYKMGKGLGATTLAKIAQTYPEIRYIAFSRILRNEKDREFETIPAHSETLSSGLVVERGDLHKKRSVRTMAARIEIYDCKTLGLVFSGNRVDASSRDTTYGDIAGGDGFDVIDGLLSKGDSNYQPYPKEVDVLNEIFGKFGEALPRVKK